jgi:flagellar biosynthesis protein FlhG
MNAHELPYALNPSVRPFDRPARLAQIWAVGGGKGGVGKSLLSSSIGILLAKQNQRVIAVDLDIGGANLHTNLGLEMPPRSLDDFLSGRTQDLQACLTPTAVPHLSLISGTQDASALLHLPTKQKVRLLESLRKLSADHLIFDLGAGINVHTIDFFLASDKSILSIVPEPSSIENAYRFLKSAYFRHFRSCPQLKKVAHLIDAAVDPKNSLGIQNPAQLLREIDKLDPESGAHFRTQLERLRPVIVLNQIRAQTDSEIGLSIKRVCKQYFGLEVDFAGTLEHDHTLWQSSRRKKPFAVEFPNSKIIESLSKIVQNLVLRGGPPSPNPL